MAAPLVSISGHPLVSPFIVKCDHPCVISAEVTGRPVPSVTWYIDCGEKVVDGPEFQLERHDEGRKHSLTISNIDEHFNKRLLTIYAVNVHGCDTSMMDLKTFKVYQRYRPPDIRRISTTLGSSGSNIADSPRRRSSIRPRRQCHSMPRSLNMASNLPPPPPPPPHQHDKPDHVMSQTYKATPSVNEPVAIVRSASVKPNSSRRVHSTQSYDSGIADTVLLLRPPLLPFRRSSSGRGASGGSADDVFLPTKTTTFGESYDLCPDDTPLFVDIPYSRPVYFSVPAANNAKRDRTLVADAKRGVPSHRRTSSGYQPQAAANGVAAAVSDEQAEMTPPLPPPLITVYSGRADLGENVWVMAGRKVSDVCYEMLAHHHHRPEEEEKTGKRIPKDRSKEKSRKTIVTTDHSKENAKRRNIEKVNKATDRRTSANDDPMRADKDKDSGRSELKIRLQDDSESGLLNQHPHLSSADGTVFVAKQSERTKAPVKDARKIDAAAAADIDVSEHFQSKSSTSLPKPHHLPAAAGDAKRRVDREKIPKIELSLAEVQLPRPSKKKTIKAQAESSNDRDSSPIAKKQHIADNLVQKEERSGEIPKPNRSSIRRASSDQNKDLEQPGTSINDRNSRALEVDFKKKKPSTDGKAGITVSDNPQRQVYSDTLKEHRNLAERVNASKEVVDKDNRKQHQLVGTYQETVNCKGLTDPAKSEEAQRATDVKTMPCLPQFDSDTAADRNGTKINYCDANGQQQQQNLKQIEMKEDPEKGKAMKRIFIQESVIVKSRRRNDDNRGNRSSGNTVEKESSKTVQKKSRTLKDKKNENSVDERDATTVEDSEGDRSRRMKSISNVTDDTTLTKTRLTSEMKSVGNRDSYDKDLIGDEEDFASRPIRIETSQVGRSASKRQDQGANDRDNFNGKRSKEQSKIRDKDYAIGGDKKQHKNDLDAPQRHIRTDSEAVSIDDAKEKKVRSLEKNENQKMDEIENSLIENDAEMMMVENVQGHVIDERQSHGVTNDGRKVAFEVNECTKIEGKSTSIKNDDIGIRSIAADEGTMADGNDHSAKNDDQRVTVSDDNEGIMIDGNGYLARNDDERKKGKAMKRIFIQESVVVKSRRRNDGSRGNLSSENTVEIDDNKALQKKSRTQKDKKSSVNENSPNERDATIVEEPEGDRSRQIKSISNVTDGATLTKTRLTSEMKSVGNRESYDKDLIGDEKDSASIRIKTSQTDRSASTRKDYVGVSDLDNSNGKRSEGQNRKKNENYAIIGGDNKRHEYDLDDDKQNIRTDSEAVSSDDAKAKKVSYLEKNENQKMDEIERSLIKNDAEVRMVENVKGHMIDERQSHGGTNDGRKVAFEVNECTKIEGKSNSIKNDDNGISTVEVDEGTMSDGNDHSVDDNEGAMIDGNGILARNDDQRATVFEGKEGTMIDGNGILARNDDQTVIVFEDNKSVIIDGNDTPARNDDQRVAVCEDNEGVLIDDNETPARNDDQRVTVFDGKECTLIDGNGILARNDDQRVAVYEDNEGALNDGNETPARNDDQRVTVFDGKEGTLIDGNDSPARNDGQGVAVCEDNGVVIDDNDMFAMTDDQRVTVSEDNEGTKVDANDIPARNDDQRVSVSEDNQGVMIDGYDIATRNDDSILIVNPGKGNRRSEEINRKKDDEGEVIVNEENQTTDETSNRSLDSTTYNEIEDRATITDDDDDDVRLTTDDVNGTDLHQSTKYDDAEEIGEERNEETIDEPGTMEQRKNRQSDNTDMMMQTSGTDKRQQQYAYLHNCSEIGDPQIGYQTGAKNSADDEVIGDWVVDNRNVEENGENEELSGSDEGASRNKVDPLLHTVYSEWPIESISIVDNADEGDICIDQFNVLEEDNTSRATNDGASDQSYSRSDGGNRDTLDDSELNDRSMKNDELITNTEIYLAEHIDYSSSDEDGYFLSAEDDDDDISSLGQIDKNSSLVGNYKTSRAIICIEIPSLEGKIARATDGEATKISLHAENEEIMSSAMPENVSSPQHNDGVCLLRNVGEYSLIERTAPLSSLVEDEETLSCAKNPEISSPQETHGFFSTIEKNDDTSSLERSASPPSLAKEEEIRSFSKEGEISPQLKTVMHTSSQEGIETYPLERIGMSLKNDEDMSQSVVNDVISSFGKTDVVLSSLEKETLTAEEMKEDLTSSNEDTVSPSTLFEFSERTFISKDFVEMRNHSTIEKQSIDRTTRPLKLFPFNDKIPINQMSVQPLTTRNDIPIVEHFHHVFPDYQNVAVEENQLRIQSDSCQKDNGTGRGHADGKDDDDSVQEITSDEKDWTGKKRKQNMEAQKEAHGNSTASQGYWEKESRLDMHRSTGEHDLMEQQHESVSPDSRKLLRNDKKKEFKTGTEYECGTQNKTFANENLAIADHNKSGVCEIKTNIGTNSTTVVEMNECDDDELDEGQNISEETLGCVLYDNETEEENNEGICTEHVSELENNENNEDVSGEQIHEEVKNDVYNEQIGEEYRPTNEDESNDQVSRSDTNENEYIEQTEGQKKGDDVSREQNVSGESDEEIKTERICSEKRNANIGQNTENILSQKNNEEINTEQIGSEDDIEETSTQHIRSEENSGEISTEHIESEENSEEILTEHIESEENSEEISTEHIESEENSEEILTEHIESEENSEEISTEHIESEENSEEISTEHFESEENSEEISTEHFESEENIDEILTEHMKSEENREDISNEHIKSEEKRIEISNEDIQSEENSKEISTEHIESEENSEEISTEHIESEKNSEEILTEYIDSEENSEEISTEYIDSEENSEDISTEHIEAQVNSEEMSAEHIESEENIEEISTVHIESEENGIEISRVHIESEENSEEIWTEYIDSEENSEEISAVHIESEENSEEISTEHMKSEEKRIEISTEYSQSEENSEEISTEHIESEENSEEISTEHIESEENSEEISTEHIESEENSKEISTEHVESDENSEEISTEQIESEEKSEEILTEHIESEENSEEILTEHIESEENSEQISTEHIESEENSEKISTEHTKAQVNSEEMSAEHIESEENIEEISTVHIESEENSEEIWTEYIDSEENSEEISTEHIESEENSEEISTEHMKSEEKRIEISTEDSQSEKNSKEISAEHIESEENSEEILTEHIESEENSEEILTEHIESEENSEQISTEHIESEENSEEISTEHIESEENSEEISSEHMKSEKKRIEISTEDVQSEENSKEISTEYIDSEENSEEISTEYIESEENSEEISTEHIEAQVNSEEMSSEHIDSEENIEEISRVHIESEENSEEISTEHIDSDENSEEISIKHIDSEENSEEILTKHIDSEENSEEISTKHIDSEENSEEISTEHIDSEENSEEISTKHIDSEENDEDTLIEEFISQPNNEEINTDGTEAKNEEINIRQISLAKKWKDVPTEEIDSEEKNEDISSVVIGREEQQEGKSADQIGLEENNEEISIEQVDSDKKNESIYAEQVGKREKNEDISTEEADEQRTNEGTSTEGKDEEDKKEQLRSEQRVEEEKGGYIFIDEMNEEDRSHRSLEQKSNKVVLCFETDDDAASSFGPIESSSSGKTNDISSFEKIDELSSFDQTCMIPLSEHNIAASPITEKIDQISSSDKSSVFPLYERTGEISFDKPSGPFSPEKFAEISSLEISQEIFSSSDKAQEISSPENDDQKYPSENVCNISASQPDRKDSSDVSWVKVNQKQGEGSRPLSYVKDDTTHCEKVEVASSEFPIEKYHDSVSFQHIADDISKRFEVSDLETLDESMETEKTILHESRRVSTQMSGDIAVDSEIILTIKSSSDSTVGSTKDFEHFPSENESDASDKMDRDNDRCMEYDGTIEDKEEQPLSSVPFAVSPSDSGFFSLNPAASSLTFASAAASSMGRDLAEDLTSSRSISSTRPVLLEADEHQGRRTMLMDRTDFDSTLLPLMEDSTPSSSPILNSNDSLSLRSVSTTNIASTSMNSTHRAGPACTLFNSRPTYQTSAGRDQKESLDDNPSVHGVLPKHQPGNRLDIGKGGLFSNIRYSTEASDALSTFDSLPHQSNAAADDSEDYFLGSSPDGDSLRRRTVVEDSDTETGKDGDKEPEAPTNNRTVYVLGALAGALVAGVVAYAVIRHFRVDINKDGGGPT